MSANVMQEAQFTVLLLYDSCATALLQPKQVSSRWAGL